MFSEPLVALMVMLLLCFIGMLVMFLYVLRSLSSMSLAFREGLRRQENVMADLERQLMDMSFTLRHSLGRTVGDTGGEQDVLSPGNGDLRPLFERMDPTETFAGKNLERSAGAAGLFGASRVSNGGAYPSAAGLDPLEHDLSAPGSSRDVPESDARRARAGGRTSGGLELRLDR